MDYSQLPYNPIAERIVDILVNKTQNTNRDFFRLQANFYISLVASVMGTKINSKITGIIPVNLYGVNLSASGSGKGFSTNVLENEIFGHFKHQFLAKVYPEQVETNIALLAQHKAKTHSLDYDKVHKKLINEFNSYGSFTFMFDSATTPAIKQYRKMLLIAGIGAIDISIDEIGSNLSGNTEALTSFLELFDKGLIKSKLIKNTESEKRRSEVMGMTPANLMMFGTPSKLLDGAKTEDDFFSFLETGYARRCFFAYSHMARNLTNLDPEELYDMLSDSQQEKDLQKIANRFLSLAHSSYCNKELSVPKDSGVELLRYRIDCEKRASLLPEHCEIQKAELTHRYFKVLKLAGAYAFMELSPEIKVNHIHQAVRLAEDSGNAIERMFRREKPYEKLAKFIAGNKGKQLTQVDLANELPFYKGGVSVKQEMMLSAIAWGYRNNIIIKKLYKDGIEFFSGETLEPTDLTKLIISYSTDMAHGYVNDTINIANLGNMLTYENLNWTNHHTEQGHRSEKTMIEGFNCVVLDVDCGVRLKSVIELLKDYTYVIHTTKRHGSEMEVSPGVYEPQDRFRIVLPMNYQLKLNAEDFSMFMQSVKEWCPFSVDEATFQRSRKWACHKGAEVYTNEGKLLDVLPFIPQTARYEEYQKNQITLQSMDNLERWFALKMRDGNRNNTLAQFAFMLVDAGYNQDEIQSKLFDFNSKLANKLDESEIINTVLTSVRNKLTK